MSIIKGSLYVVATPIGNVDDLSTRAINILSNVDIILAEDTRHSGRLLQKLGIRTTMLPYHDHNENKQIPSIVKRLKNGEVVAIISDAGTPLISDPGYSLVKAVHQAGLRVIPIPGPSALIGALSVAGQSTDRFIFEGFLPAKKKARQDLLQALSTELRTLVFYEVPHRIMQSLEDMIQNFGSERGATLAKELTKIHENIIYGTLLEIKDWLLKDETRQKGEFVLIIEGTDKNTFDVHEATRILQLLLQSLSTKEAARIASEMMQGHKNELYQLALALKNKS